MRDNASLTFGRDPRRFDRLTLVPRDRRCFAPGVPASFLVRDACTHYAGRRQIDRGADDAVSNLLTDHAAGF